jgi:1-deoxy-D-xylulose-5-phosphate synthase
MVIEKINSPECIKKLPIEELKKLASEMRDVICKKVNAIGGHMAPNLGIVETTLIGVGLLTAFTKS